MPQGVVVREACHRHIVILYCANLDRDRKIMLKSIEQTIIGMPFDQSDFTYHSTAWSPHSLGTNVS